jgi:hypothetical protein
LAIALDPDPNELKMGDKLLSGQFFKGYVGIDESAGVPDDSAEGERFPSNVRFVAQDTGAAMHVLRCLIGRTIRNGTPIFDRGTCFGSGIHRGVIFEVNFDLTTAITEGELSVQIRTLINEMLD